MVKWCDGDDTGLYLLDDRSNGHIFSRFFEYIRAFWIGNCLHLSVDEEVLKQVPRLYLCFNRKHLSLINTRS